MFNTFTEVDQRRGCKRMYSEKWSGKLGVVGKNRKAPGFRDLECRDKHSEVFVMTTLRKVLDFIDTLPSLFSLYYYHPEHSGTFHDDPLTSIMMHTLDHSSMT